MKSNAKYLAFLTALLSRAHLHQPVTAAQFSDGDHGIKKMIENVEDEGGEEQAAKDYAELVLGARAGDVAMRAELSSIRQIRANNFLIARSNVMTFFDGLVLGPKDIPYIRNESRMEIDVAYIGQDGRARKQTAIKYQEDAQCALKIVGSAEFEYPLKDLIRGILADEVKGLIDIAFDLDRKIDALAWPYIVAKIAAFTLTGSKAARTYVPHSAIAAGNLPTTNLLVSSSSGSATRFNKDCLDAILDYVGAFADTFADGALQPVAVYIPSIDSQGWLRSITMTSQPNSLVEQVIHTGAPLNYGGRNWLFVPDATLSPTAGLAYVKMNKPVGTFFTKPAMDDMFVDESVALRRQNKGNMSMQKAVGWGLPTSQAVNVAAVRYKTNGT